MTSTQGACRVVSYLSLRTGEGASVVPHSLGSTGIFKHNKQQQFELIYKASLKEHSYEEMKKILMHIAHVWTRKWTKKLFKRTLIMFGSQTGKFTSLKTVREQLVNNCIWQPVKIVCVKRLR